MNEYISYIITVLPQILAGGGYWILFLIVILEGLPILGSFVPGHVAIITAGFLAKLGVLDLTWVIILAIVAAVCGDVCAFLWGRKKGYAFLQHLCKYVFLKEEHVEKAKKIIDKHTGKAIVLGKFSPVTRSLVPFLVGGSGVHINKFWIFNIIGSAIWVTISVFVGYVFGASYHVVSQYLGNFMVIAVIATILIVWSYRFINRQFHFFKKYELFILGLNILSLWTLAKTIQDRFSDNPFMVNFDESVNVFVNNYTTPLLHELATWTSVLGGTGVLLTITCIIGVMYIFHKKWRRGVIILTSLGSTAIVLSFLKEIFRSPRPLNALQSLSDFSFPSGHAAVSAAFFLALAYIVSSKIESWIKREVFIVLCVMAIILIGLSRLILSVHWASDVIAGWSLGIFLATGSILLVRYLGGLFLSNINYRDTK
jgi:membrane protein DedA with SNARE-associated domain